MAKKLTKREWYLAAQFWGEFGDGKYYDLGVMSEEVARREIELDDNYEGYADRVCLYYQFCLEKAGL